jgi:hypothetical protein
MRAPLEFPRSRGFDRAYWLSRCQGFRVETGDGRRLGSVVDLQYRSNVGQPDRLVVRRHWIGRRVEIVSVSSVAAILPGEERIVLRPESAEGSLLRKERKHGSRVWSNRRTH